MTDQNIKCVLISRIKYLVLLLTVDMKTLANSETHTHTILTAQANLG